MVVKKSEYQKQYKACVIKKHHEIYLENLNLRHQRRDREFMHTPLYWEELSEEEKESSSDCCEEGQPKASKPQKPREPENQYQSLAEILSDSKEKAEAVRKQKQADALAVPSSLSGVIAHKSQKSHPNVPTKANAEEKPVKETDLTDQKSEKKDLPGKSCSINDFLDDENRKLNKKLALTYAITPEWTARDASDDTDTDPDTKTKDSLLSRLARRPSATNRRMKRKKKEHPLSQKSKDTVTVQNKGEINGSPDPTASSSPEFLVPPLHYVPRVRRPDRRAPIPRPKSTPVSPSLPVKERPPFVAYGSGDREDNLATHRTHNVRASVDVYLPALRAKSRREVQQKRQNEKVHKTHSAEALIDKLAAPVTHNALDWESEYRKQYHGYEPRDYKRAASAHAVIPRSTPVRAVHRGGCLLVHVD